MSSLQLTAFLTLHTKYCKNTGCDCKSVQSQIWKSGQRQLNKNTKVYATEATCPKHFHESCVHKLLKYMLADFEVTYGRSNTFAFVLAEAYFYYFANFYYSWGQLNLIMLRKPTISMKQRVYNLFRMINMGLEMSQTEKDPECILEALDYVRYYNSFLEQVEESAELTIRFWSLLLEELPTAEVLNQLGKRLFKSKSDLMKTVHYISRISSSHIDFLIRYGLFMKYIMQDNVSSDQVFKQIYYINESSSLYAIRDSKYSLFRADVSVMLVVAFLENPENVNIIEINSEVEKNLGYGRGDLVGFSISNLMPPNIAQVHGRCIQEFLQTMKAKILGIPRILFVKKKDGLYCQCESFKKLVPRLSDGMQIAMLMIHDSGLSLYCAYKSAKTLRKTGAILCDSEHRIFGFSKEAADILKLSYEGVKEIARGTILYDLFPQLTSPDLLDALTAKEGGVILFSPTQLVLECEKDGGDTQQQQPEKNIQWAPGQTLLWARLVVEEIGQNQKSLVFLFSEVIMDHRSKYSESEKVPGLFEASALCDLGRPDRIQKKKSVVTDVLQMRKPEKDVAISRKGSVASNSASVAASGSQKSSDPFSRMVNELKLHENEKKTPIFIIRLYVVIISLLAVIVILISIISINIIF